jgi:hypothetical protein
MLEAIFGNKTAEKVLLHIFHYGEIHARAIALDYGVVVNPIRNQIEKFENAGILIGKEAGRTRLYSFNPKSPLVKPIKELLKIAYESIPLEEREEIFKKRRRPRKKGKPVINGI